MALSLLILRLWQGGKVGTQTHFNSCLMFMFKACCNPRVSRLCPPVFVTLSCTFRYGRDDMDVMGIAFRRELYLSTRQVYPPLQDREMGVHTKIQAKLLRKLGNNSYPFFFEVRGGRTRSEGEETLHLSNRRKSNLSNCQQGAFTEQCRKELQHIT